MLISDWSSDVCSSDLLVPGQVLAHRDRHEAALARHLAQYPLVVVLVQLDELRQRVQHPLDVAGVLAHHHDAEILAVSGERQAEAVRSEEHTSELQSLMRISYAVFCLKKKKNNEQ